MAQARTKLVFYILIKFSCGINDSPTRPCCGDRDEIISDHHKWLFLLIYIALLKIKDLSLGSLCIDNTFNIILSQRWLILFQDESMFGKR